MNKTETGTGKQILKDYILKEKLQEVVRLYFAGCTLTEAMKLVRGQKNA